MNPPRFDPHGPLRITPDPDGDWVSCPLCQTTTLCRTADAKDAAVKAHQVQPDLDWLQQARRVGEAVRS